MEGALHWYGSGSGSDWIVALSAAQAHAGTHSLHLSTRLTDPAIGDTLVAIHNSPLQPAHQYAESTWLYLPDPDQLDYFWLWAQWASAGRTYHAHLSWILATGEGVYWDHTGNPVPVPDLDHTWAAATWTRIGIAIDPAAHQYVSGFAGADAADLSGLACQDAGASASTQIQLEVGLVTIGAAAAEAYLDDALVTYTIP